MNFLSWKLRKQFKLMIIFSFVFVIAVGYLCEFVSNLFMIALFIYFIVVSTYFGNLKCPKCGNKIFYRAFGVFGQKIPFYVSWIAKNCIKCDEPLE